MSDHGSSGVGAQLVRIMEAAGLDRKQLGRKAGYADGTHPGRVLSGDNDNHAIVRLAHALDCDVRIVPRGSKESVLSRLHEANERELKVLTGILSLMLDFRDDLRIVSTFEADVRHLRERAQLERPVPVDAPGHRH